MLGIRCLTRRCPILGGVVVCLAVVLLLGLLLGLALHFTPLPEDYLGSYSLAVITLGVFLGALVSTQEAESRALLHGCAVAGVFLLVILAITLIGRMPCSFVTLARYAAIGLVAGVLGGIVGISSR